VLVLVSVVVYGTSRFAGCDRRFEFVEEDIAVVTLGVRRVYVRLSVDKSRVAMYGIQRSTATRVSFSAKETQ
jgi:hypothetical protein